MEMQQLPMLSNKKAIRPTHHRYGLTMQSLIAYKIAAYAEKLPGSDRECVFVTMRLLNSAIDSIGGD
jgi:hypothetical protein